MPRNPRKPDAAENRLVHRRCVRRRKDGTRWYPQAAYQHGGPEWWWCPTCDSVGSRGDFYPRRAVAPKRGKR